MSAEWQFLNALNDQLRPLRDPSAIMETSVRLLGQHLGASRVHYAAIEGSEFVIRRHYTDGVTALPTRAPLTMFSESIVEALRSGETVVVDDLRTDARFTDQERARFLVHNIAALVGVPLIKGGRWLASFGVHSATPRNWTNDQIALVEITADRTWSAGERVRAEEALGRSESRQAFMRQLHETIRPLAAPARILEEVCRLLGTHLRVNRVVYAEIDGDDCIITHDYTDGVPSLAGTLQWRNLGGSRTDEILKGWTLAVNDTSAEAHTPDESAALSAACIGAYIAPLLIKEGRFVGFFAVHSRSPRVWTPDEQTLVQEVADRIWSTFEYRKAEAELRANQERLAFLLQLNDALRRLSDPGAIQATAARHLGEHLGVTRTGYTELEGREYMVRREHVRGVGPLVGPPLRIDVGPTLREALLRGETIVVGDIETDARLGEDHRATFRATEIAAFIGVALFKERQIVAAFGVNHNTPRAWTAGEIELVREVADRTWDAVERTRAESALREQETRLRLALEASAGGSWMLDLRTKEAYWDDVFRAQFGFTPDEAPAVQTWLARLHPEDLPRMMRMFEEVQQEKDRWDRTYRIVRPDGAVRWIQSLGRADRDADGAVVRLTGLELDVTERRRIEDAHQARFAKALQERTAELEYRTTQLSQMAWDLTLAEHQAREQLAKTLHDGLQQLLVIVALNLELQQKRDAEAGAVPSELVAEAKEQIDKALDVARSLNVDLFPPVLQRSGLPAALRWLANWTFAKYKMRVDIDVDPRADSPRKDIRTLLFESVRELLFNAVKHARADRVTVSLKLDDSDRLCITVTDQGAGFKPSKLDDRSKAAHVGWGLFRIRERVSLLGGSLDIDSAPGKGTRVRLVAPRGTGDTITDVDESSVARGGAAPAIDDDRISPDALRILIVDDHPAVRRALREMLHQRPQLAVVGDSANGFEAIAHANTLRPDVILMDIAMPHMDGVEATARIREALPQIRILGLSTLARSETADAIEQAGADGFFVKGTDTRRLIEQLLAYHASRGAGDRVG